MKSLHVKDATFGNFFGLNYSVLRFARPLQSKALARPQAGQRPTLPAGGRFCDLANYGKLCMTHCSPVDDIYLRISAMSTPHRCSLEAQPRCPSVSSLHHSSSHLPSFAMTPASSSAVAFASVSGRLRSINLSC